MFYVKPIETFFCQTVQPIYSTSYLSHSVPTYSTSLPTFPFPFQHIPTHTPHSHSHSVPTKLPTSWLREKQTPLPSIAINWTIFAVMSAICLPRHLAIKLPAKCVVLMLLAKGSASRYCLGKLILWAETDPATKTDVAGKLNSADEMWYCW